MSLEPLVKWAGGKRQIMKKLLMNFPKEFNNYHEPFIGAGSVFMELNNRGLLDDKKVFLSDLMMPLINLYNVVKFLPDDLISDLSKDKYSNDKDVFIMLKERFNELKKLNYNYKNMDEKKELKIELASLFIYLNKTGFNGMYRENSKGNLNISFGKQKNPRIYNKDLINYLSKFLNQSSVSIKCCNFIETENAIKKGDFIYMDPPYYGTFTGYNKEEFGKKQQEELRDFFVRLSHMGCKVALSNSNNDYIKQLYSNIENIRFIEIDVKRIINSKARGETKTELLIVNY